MSFYVYCGTQFTFDLIQSGKYMEPHDLQTVQINSFAEECDKNTRTWSEKDWTEVERRVAATKAPGTPVKTRVGVI